MSVPYPQEAAPTSMQYRPDVPNCREFAAFLGDESGCPYNDEPHGDECWWLDTDLVLECGDWVDRTPDGRLTVRRRSES